VNFNFITVFPQMVTEALAWGVIGRAQDKGIYTVKTVNPRDFTTDVHKTIDDRPFGGGDGMVMLYEPLAKAMESISGSEKMKKIYLSPSGRKLDESLLKVLSGYSDFIFLSGRYGGVDQRFLNQYEFMPVSIGDYVVSGGELPALILMDALLRKKPGVLGNEESSSQDSFANSPYLEAPLFTRPRENIAGPVPEILLSGDHKKIDEFRSLVGMALTMQNRPDLIEVNDRDKQNLKKFLQKIKAEYLKTLGFTNDFLLRFKNV
jgi:tRNA (guanine37-N1)-methyltransferase